MIDKGKLTVLAITPDAEYDDWLNHKYPDNWMTGFDKNHEIYDKRLYDIQYLPSLYLLDKSKRVLLKEANFSRLINYFARDSYNIKQK